MRRHIAMIVHLVACVAWSACGGCAGVTNEGSEQHGHPVIIAHRGASGYLPEHTLAAYALAYGQGADVIEPDVAMTRDGALICVHDLSAEQVTDVARVFPGRARADGRWYYADLTLEEVKRLHVLGRGDRRAADGDFSGFSIATFDEMIQMVQQLNRRTGRVVGIIPEPKSPAFHRENSLPIEGPLVTALTKWGYEDRGAEQGGATIQCFELDALRKIRHEHGCRLPLMWTIRDAQDEATLRKALPLIQGLGVNRQLLEPDKGAPPPPFDVAAFARHHGLRLYVWTFGDSFEDARRFCHAHRVDGLFIDYPDVGVRARR